MKKKECINCGGCCLTATFPFVDITPGNENSFSDAARWLEYHGCRVYIEEKEGIKQMLLSIPLPCKHIIKEGKKIKCKIYKTRPEVCRKFNCGIN